MRVFIVFEAVRVAVADWRMLSAEILYFVDSTVVRRKVVADARQTVVFRGRASTSEPPKLKRP